MNPSEWATVAGVLFTAGGFLWGRRYGAGKMKKRQTNFQNYRIQFPMLCFEFKFPGCDLTVRLTE